MSISEIEKSIVKMEKDPIPPKRRFFSFGKNLTKQNSLPDYGYIYFDHLRAENGDYNIELLGDNTKKEINNIIRKRDNHLLTWSDIYTFELIFTVILEGKKLLRKVWDLRNRYRDCISLAEYEAYLASKPPDVSEKAAHEELKADVEFLLSKIYLNYSINPISERARKSISRKVTIVVSVGLGFIITIGFLIFFDKINIETPGRLQSGIMFLVLFAGAMGGLLSMMQRYNSIVIEGDPLNNISSHSWNQIWISALNGALFAVLLYMIFIGKLIEGSFFPEISEITANQSGLDNNGVDYNSKITLNTLFSGIEPKSSADFAKLIVWCFIAGFAERFVPDALTKIVPKKDNDHKSV